MRLANKTKCKQTYRPIKSAPIYNIIGVKEGQHLIDEMIENKTDKIQSQ